MLDLLSRLVLRDRNPGSDLTGLEMLPHNLSFLRFKATSICEKVIPVIHMSWI